MSFIDPPGSRVGTGVAGGLFLAFAGMEDRSPTDIGGLLRDIETLHWYCVELSEEAASLRPGITVQRLRLGSPFEVVTQLPPEVWQIGTGFSFVGTLAMIFRLPGRFQQERENFWRSRLSADQAKREWIEWSEADYGRKGVRLRELVLPEGVEELANPETLEVGQRRETDAEIAAMGYAAYFEVRRKAARATGDTVTDEMIHSDYARALRRLARRRALLDETDENEPDTSA